MSRAHFVATAAACALLSLWHPRAASVAVSFLASGIAATFAWLWWRRATPLAAGLALAWGGLAMLVLGTWAGPMVTGTGLALTLIGARLHLGVIAQAGAGRIAVAGMVAALVVALPFL